MSNNIFKRALFLDRHKCQAPGCAIKALQPHHIIPRSQRGPDELWNVICLCVLHHRMITDKKMTDIYLLTGLKKYKRKLFRWQKALDWHLKREELRKLKNDTD
jgi:hypothetical protein